MSHRNNCLAGLVYAAGMLVLAGAGVRRDHWLKVKDFGASGSRYETTSATPAAVASSPSRSVSPAAAARPARLPWRVSQSP